MFDQGVVHQWIRARYFGGDQKVWVYNGAACWMSDGSIVYTCRVRDNQGHSRVFAQLFKEGWVPKSNPAYVGITIQVNPKFSSDVGPQDARVFEFRGKAWIVFNMLRPTKQGNIRQMHVHRVNSGFSHAIPLAIKGSTHRSVEKNWTPFVRGGILHFIYSFCPLVVLAVPDVHLIDPKLQPEAECMVVFAERCDKPKPEMRGGTPAIETSPGVFEGFLHSTRPLSAAHLKFDASELPYPARRTDCFYRTHRFKLYFNPSSTTPKVEIGEEISFFGKQIELVYGWDGRDQVIVNVNDKATVITDLPSTDPR